MTIITSRSNAKIKAARSLRGRKARQKSGLFLVEGIRHIGEALEAGADFQSIFYTTDFLRSDYAHKLIADASQAGIPCYATTGEVFVSLAEKEKPQGILAVINRPQLDLNDLNPENFPRGVALVSPQDPGNLGTILRTIDAVGASGLLLLEESVDPYHPTAIRASMGTIFWHPVVSVKFKAFASWVQQHPYNVYGTSAQSSIDYRQVERYQMPNILLMGSERQGLDQIHMNLCHSLIHLPMHGRGSSLNLGVAAGVMLFDMMDKQNELDGN